MKHLISASILIFMMATSCTSVKNLAYLNNLPRTQSKSTFQNQEPDYKIQPRDILYITIKAITPDGSINDFLLPARNNAGGNLIQGEPGGYLYGYDVDSEGFISVPAVGKIKVGGLTISEARTMIQVSASKVFKNSLVECKILSYRYTVIGEVKTPGTFINYNNYLTIFEAIGRAGGLNDFGDRKNVLVIRSVEDGTETYSVNVQDKNILASKAYYLLPNDVIIVQPLKHKIFNLNLPTISFIFTALTSSITTTLLLINYFRK